MSGRVRGLALLLALLAGAACAHAPAGGKAQTFALDAGQAGTLSGGGRIVFANVVNDSRCPRFAKCAWAGTVTVRFRLVPAASRGDTASVLCVLPGGVARDAAGEQLPVDTLGVRITLLELTPYPVAGEPATGRPRALVRVAPLP